MSISELRIPPAPGSYLLALYLRRGQRLNIGRLGEQHFRRGWYLYAGSAFGPGGLRARLKHHLRPLQNFHWHIDYLRQQAELRWLLLQVGQNHEHHWSALLTRLPGAERPMAGFGASDCACFSHLLYLPRQPGRQQLAAIDDDLAGKRLWNR